MFDDGDVAERSDPFADSLLDRRGIGSGGRRHDSQTERFVKPCAQVPFKDLSFACSVCLSQIKDAPAELGARARQKNETDCFGSRVKDSKIVRIIAEVSAGIAEIEPRRVD